MISVDARPQQISQPIKGSEAFRLEYNPTIPEKALYNDIISYLGEYRFQVQKYQYKLFYTLGTSAAIEDSQAIGLHIRGEEKGKSLLAIGKKGIEDRRERGLVTQKVVADYLGMQQMEKQIAEANDGDTIMYASPADSEEGYAYGFFYIGHVVVEEGQEHILDNSKKEKHLEMTAIRLESHQDLDRYNTAVKLLTGENPKFSTVNQFIAHPKRVQRKISMQEIDFVMKGIFDFAMDSKRQKDFAKVIQSMSPYIQEFINLVKSGASHAVLEPAFYALENYALELQAKPEIVPEVPMRRENAGVHMQPNLAGLVQTHGYEPPKATGSCGSTSKKNKLGSTDLYGQGSLWEGEINKLSSNELDSESESDGFECPNCHVGRVKGNECPHCHITAEKWVEMHPELACV